MTGERILAVDDNPANLKLIEFLLKGEGYEIRTARDAEQALQLLPEFRPRLILMDLQLPGMSGLELTRRLKASPATKDVRILALTAFAMKGDEQRALDAGCDGYVAKPIDVETLPALISGYLVEGRS
jgi:CheY-like chemotaxis protein